MIHITGVTLNIVLQSETDAIKEEFGASLRRSPVLLTLFFVSRLSCRVSCLSGHMSHLRSCVMSAMSRVTSVGSYVMDVMSHITSMMPHVMSVMSFAACHFCDVTGHTSDVSCRVCSVTYLSHNVTCLFCHITCNLSQLSNRACVWSLCS